MRKTFFDKIFGQILAKTVQHIFLPKFLAKTMQHFLFAQSFGQKITFKNPNKYFGKLLAKIWPKFYQNSKILPKFCCFGQKFYVFGQKINFWPIFGQNIVFWPNFGQKSIFETNDPNLSDNLFSFKQQAS